MKPEMSMPFIEAAGRTSGFNEKGQDHDDPALKRIYYHF
jgi:hypothetical protein